MASSPPFTPTHSPELLSPSCPLLSHRPISPLHLRLVRWLAIWFPSSVLLLSWLLKDVPKNTKVMTLSSSCSRSQVQVLGAGILGCMALLLPLDQNALCPDVRLLLQTLLTLLGMASPPCPPGSL